MTNPPDGLLPVRFTFSLQDIACEDSGAGPGQFTVRGHAAVFNRTSHDAGGFRWKIAKGAFTKALDANPDVHLVLNHDMRWVLARTTNGTLELREDPMGLHMWARVAPVSYASDLRVLMDRGDIDQMSFAGYIERDEWTIDEDENVTCTILEFSELLDATICPQGMFPQTDVSVVASRQATQHYANALQAGRVPGRAPEGTSPLDEGESIAAPDEPVDEQIRADQAATRKRSLALARTKTP